MPLDIGKFPGPIRSSDFIVLYMLLPGVFRRSHHFHLMKLWSFPPGQGFDSGDTLQLCGCRSGVDFGMVWRIILFLGHNGDRPEVAGRSNTDRSGGGSDGRGDWVFGSSQKIVFRALSRGAKEKFLG